MPKTSKTIAKKDIKQRIQSIKLSLENSGKTVTIFAKDPDGKNWILFDFLLRDGKLSARKYGYIGNKTDFLLDESGAIVVESA